MKGLRRLLQFNLPSRNDKSLGREQLIKFSIDMARFVEIFEV